MMIRPLILALSLTAMTSAAFAQMGGTPEERRACRPDVRRLCRGVDPSDMSMLNCLRAHARKLSRACRKVLEDHGQL